MQALYDFIVEPVGERYNNVINVEDKKLIVNTKIETFKAVNKLAKVLATPKNAFSKIQVGDLVMVHHNVFRRYYDMKGREKNSRSYFKDNKYFVSIDQIYLYHNGKWNTVNDRCFIKPIKNKSQIGYLVYGNEYLNSINIKPNKKVYYKAKREFEFIVDNELLYCMKSKDLLLEDGYKENKTKDNISR